MPQALQCEIVTPERLLYSQDASFVVLPAAAGEMGIYYQHSPQVTTLNSGCVRITPTSEEETDIVKIAVSGGYAQVDGEKVIVLASRAMLLSEVDEAATRDAVSQLEDQISGAAEDDPDTKFKQNQLDWNKLLLHLVEAKQ